MLEQRLRAARKAKKITQEGLAKSLNTTKGTISNYENGYSTPSNEMLILLSNALDCSTDYLLGKIDTPYPKPTGEPTPNLKAWLRQTNSDLNEEQLEGLEEDIEDYLATRMKRILDRKK